MKITLDDQYKEQGSQFYRKAEIEGDATTAYEVVELFVDAMLGAGFQIGSVEEAMDDYLEGVGYYDKENDR